MLSAQRREFDEKKKDESPYPRDFTRWNILDYLLHPRGLRARRFYVTLGTTLVFTLISLASAVPGLHHVHQAGPVAPAHARHANDCGQCHDRAFQPVKRLFGSADASTSDNACRHCHKATTLHHAKQAHEPACASCHREHQGHLSLARNVAEERCTECHAELDAHVMPGTKLAFHGTIHSFADGHPEFGPSAKGKKDPARIHFNHKAHLDLDIEALRSAQAKAGREDLKGLSAKLDCADCHQMDDARKYLQPIRYENHCARCHALNVAIVHPAANLKEAAAAFSKVAAPHKEPAIVRGVLRDRLVAFAQTHHVVGKAEPALPRPLPWKPVTDEQWTWASDQTRKTEAMLFLNKQWDKSAAMTPCAHCHVEKGRVDGLPVYEPTGISKRWYTHSVFNHGSHRTMTCAECHDQNSAGIKVADSKTSADILLPNLQSCQKCHSPSGGARSSCVECHRYHAR